MMGFSIVFFSLFLSRPVFFRPAALSDLKVNYRVLRFAFSKFQAIDKQGDTELK